VKRLNPERLDQEKIEFSFGAMALDAMDEQVIRIQLMGHHQVINALHPLNILRDGACCQPQVRRGTVPMKRKRPGDSSPGGSSRSLNYSVWPSVEPSEQAGTLATTSTG